MDSKWNKDQFPVELKYGDNFSASEIHAIESAGDSWSEATDNEFEFFDFLPSMVSFKENVELYDDNELGVYKLDTWPEDLPATALAVTQIYGEPGTDKSGKSYIKIDHADILINYEYYNFVTDESWGYDLESIILHEMGHFLGLKHNQDSSEVSIMYPTISKYDNARYPKSVDIDLVLELYNQTSNKAVEQTRHLISSNKKQRIKILLEIYPDGKENMKVKIGDNHEILHSINCLKH